MAFIRQQILARATPARLRLASRRAAGRLISVSSRCARSFRRMSRSKPAPPRDVNRACASPSLTPNPPSRSQRRQHFVHRQPVLSTATNSPQLGINGIPLTRTRWLSALHAVCSLRAGIVLALLTPAFDGSTPLKLSIGEVQQHDDAQHCGKEAPHGDEPPGVDHVGADEGQDCRAAQHLNQPV